MLCQQFENTNSVTTAISSKSELREKQTNNTSTEQKSEASRQTKTIQINLEPQSSKRKDKENDSSKQQKPRSRSKKNTKKIPKQRRSSPVAVAPVITVPAIVPKKREILSQLMNPVLTKKPPQRPKSRNSPNRGRTTYNFQSRSITPRKYSQTRLNNTQSSGMIKIIQPNFSDEAAA